ncbi:hypothetical protein ACOMHN_004393 [Nucella lapillus]
MAPALASLLQQHCESHTMLTSAIILTHTPTLLSISPPIRQGVGRGRQKMEGISTTNYTPVTSSSGRRCSVAGEASHLSTLSI